MVYAPHTLVAFGGRLNASLAGGVDEIWECTVRGVQLDDHTRPVTNPQAYVDGVAGPLAAWYASVTSLMNGFSSLDFVKANSIGPDGKYSDPSTVHRHDYTPGIGGGLTPVFPDIISCCWSWRSAKTRGPGSHGRIYPPNNTIGVSNNMALDSAARDRHLTAAQNLMHVLSVGDGDLAEMTPVIASKVNATNTPITEIWIGSILDVQRRRKSAETEIYTKGVIFP